MNNNYNKKKRITIIFLSILAVCLAVALIWYVRMLGKTEVPVVEPEISEAEQAPTVPKIDTGSTVETETGSEQKTEGQGDTGAEPETEDSSAEENRQEELSTVPGILPAREDGKTRTPDEAVPPSEAPADTEVVTEMENPDEDGDCQPEHVQPTEDLPEGGDTNAEGAVYVPGFGYIENSGQGEQETSGTDGDWNKQIGTMQ